MGSRLTGRQAAIRLVRGNRQVPTRYPRVDAGLLGDIIDRAGDLRTTHRVPGEQLRGQNTMGGAGIDDIDGIKVPVRESWLIKTRQDAVYAIIYDFQAMLRNFTKVAHSIPILERDGNLLTIEAESASFGRFFFHGPGLP